jgi:TonB family protein
MIPRILVPVQLLPVPAESETPPRRTSTFLDERSVIPAELPVVPLDGRSNIPAHVPLEVLGERIVVPRNMPQTPLVVQEELPSQATLTVLDERMAVPQNARPKSLRMERPVPIERLEGVVEPDVLTTGQVNLLISPEEQGKKIPAGLLRWLPQSGTALLHAAIVFLAVLQPYLFPYKAPSESEIAVAARSLGKVYLPPSLPGPPSVPSPPPAPRPQIRIDPRVLRQILPPQIEYSPPPPQPAPALPDAPRPQREQTVQPEPLFRGSPETRAESSPREGLRLEPPRELPSNPSLVVPRMSAGRAIEESARGAARGGSGNPQGGFSDRMPGRGGGLGGSGLGGIGDGNLSGGFELLTPTEGVDFTDYLTRVLNSVRRNWYAVIPESARLGEQGRVVLEFRIMRNGVVPLPEPELTRGSGREPLDRAAVSAIRASSPFGALPSGFSGPFIRLRFIFLYNLPLNSQ